MGFNLNEVSLKSNRTMPRLRDHTIAEPGRFRQRLRRQGEGGFAVVGPARPGRGERVCGQQERQQQQGPFIKDVRTKGGRVIPKADIVMEVALI